MDFFTKAEIQICVYRIDLIIGSNIFGAENYTHPLVQSAFTELIVLVQYLMARCNEFNQRVAFTDDVIFTPEVKDVSDAIRVVRNAACHLDSPKHKLQNDKVTFVISYGINKALDIGGISRSSDYADDVCFFYGQHRLYLNRHILRAYEEAKQKLLPLI